MSSIIRKAVTSDAESLFRLKEQLPMPVDGDATSKGGFILGTTVAQYAVYIKDAYCLVAETDEKIVGFGIIIPDAMLRKSDIWLRRNQVQWNIDLLHYEQMELAYFEQLAFLPGHRRLAIRLAYRLMDTIFSGRVHALFTTTVNRPIRNLAAIPFIKAVNGVHAGNIDEYYEKIGAINSDIYAIGQETFYETLMKHPVYPFLIN